MKFSVGYQWQADGRFLKQLLAEKDSLYEVYFSYGNFANGRHTAGVGQGMNPWEAGRRMEKDLKRLNESGISFNLLLNGNCYGDDALSRRFFCSIGDCLESLLSGIALKSVTTTSPLIAKFIHQNFPGILTRASVNMEIATPQAMEFIGDCFDGYYARRELNREAPAFDAMSDWCRKNGKQLFALANSGCLNHCPAHTFHDNLVAHENGIAARDNTYGFEGICRDFFAKEENRLRFLEVTNFIPPQSVSLFEGKVEAMKLATRVHPAPERVLLSYLGGAAHGNMIDLLEPCHGNLFYPWILDTGKLTGFLENHPVCTGDCNRCGYCREYAKKAFTKLTDTVSVDRNKENKKC